MASSRNNTLEFSSAGSQILGSGDESTITSIGAIQVINDTVLDTLTSSNIDTSLQALTGSTSPVLPAGTIIYGQISAVKVVSGLVALHRV
jgi:hypothetical protein